MTSIGTWMRTLASLTPRQVLARPLFAVRRKMATVAPSVPHRGSHARSHIGPPHMVLGDAQLADLQNGKLTLAGVTGDLDVVEPTATEPLYVYAFHELAWLRAALDAEPQLRAKLLAWLRTYLAHSHEQSSKRWDPYPLATRILVLDALLANGDIEKHYAELIARETLVLAKLVEHHIGANHLLRNRAALAVGSRHLGQDDHARACEAYVAESEAQFLSDGMHEERTPSYHALALLDMLDVLATCDANARVALRDRAAHAMTALTVVTHEDDRVCAFGDSTPLSTPRTRAILAYGRALGAHTTRPAPEHGHSTLGASGFSTIASKTGIRAYLTHGPFGAPTQPGHAHCDLFAFELDANGERLIVDPGVHAYHDAEWRTRTRESASHSTLAIPGREQAEIWSRFRCGYRPVLREATWSRGSFRGTADVAGPADPVHIERVIMIGDDALSILDEASSPFSVALQLAPGTRFDVSTDNITIRGQKGAIRLSSRAPLSLEDGYVSHTYGARIRAPRLRLSSEHDRLSMRFEQA